MVLTERMSINRDTIRAYYHLTKPGIIWGNAIAATGGFMLASAGNTNWFLYAFTLLGISLIVASGCVFNNIIDTDIDSLMSRTEKRELVVGKISKKSAMLFAYVIGICGFLTLYFYTNFPAFLVGLFGFYVYVIMYSIFYKRSSVHGTLIGSASGAAPPVIGYVAVTGQLDVGALLIFLGFCAWQMPHSYAIAIFREHDYHASSIPLLPIVRGIKSAQKQMLFYTALYWLSIILLFWFGYIGYISVIVLSGICVFWIYQMVSLYKPQSHDFDERVWGKKLFITSILAVSVYSLVLSLDFLFI